MLKLCFDFVLVFTVRLSSGIIERAKIDKKAKGIEKFKKLF